MQAHVLGHDAEAVRDSLGERCLVALAGTHQAHGSIDRAGGGNLHPGGLVSRTGDAGGLVEGGAVGGGFDDGANPHAAIDAVGPVGGLPGAECRDIEGV